VKNYIKKIGIYRILNLINNKVYIGSSIDIERMLKQHKNDLNKNKHWNKSLQEDWNLYGYNYFKLEAIEYCSSDSFVFNENKWMIKNTPELTYNIPKICKTTKEKKRICLFCEICNCSEDETPKMYTARNKFKKVLCSKHYEQLKHHGKILTRTIFDKNEYIIHDTYAEICLYNKKGEEIAKTKIDLEDVEKCKEHKWCLVKGYVKAGNRSYSLCLHRFVMNIYNINDIVDHIYHDTLDNRKSELRIATKQQNQINRRISPQNKSGVTGVRYNKNKWEANITLNGKTLYLGSFINKEDAIKTRKEAEEKYFGEFAYKEKNV